MFTNMWRNFSRGEDLQDHILCLTRKAHWGCRTFRWGGCHTSIKWTCHALLKRRKMSQDVKCKWNLREHLNTMTCKTRHKSKKVSSIHVRTCKRMSTRACKVLTGASECARFVQWLGTTQTQVEPIRLCEDASIARDNKINQEYGISPSIKKNKDVEYFIWEIAP